jgi:uncharacterized membrane protein
MIPEMNRIVSLDARAVDWAHIHILLNHFPVILAITGMLAVLLAMLRGQRAIWIYGAVSLTLAAITVIPTYFTGEPAEHALNRPWYIARGVIHTHEDASKIASLLVLLAGLVAVVAWRRLVRYPREVRMPGSLRTALIVTALAAAGAIGYSSWLGGRIVHDSPVLLGPPPAGFVRPGAPPPATPAPMTPAPATPAPMSPVP